MAIIKYGRKKNETFYIDKRLKLELDMNLDFSQNQDDDVVIVLSGAEGAGKSTLAKQIIFYAGLILKRPVTVEGNIHFDLDDYVDTSLEKGKCWINMLDESRKILNKKRQMGKATVRFTDYLSECRSKNQIHLLLVPSYHDLDPYVVNWRMTFLIEVKKRKEWDEKEGKYMIRRGNYVIHGKRESRTFYNNPETRYRYPRHTKEDLCQFPKFDPFPEQAYNEKKEKHTIAKYHSEEFEKAQAPTLFKKIMSQRDSLIRFIRAINPDKYSNRVIANVTSMNPDSISRLLRYDEDKDKWTKLLDNIEEKWQKKNIKT